MKYKAIIFDLDGTLLDTIHYIAECMNTTLEKFGYPVHEISEYKNFVGSGMTELVTRAMPENSRNKDKIAVLEKYMKKLYHEKGAENISPYPGIDEMLTKVKATGIKTAVLSNKVEAFTKNHVEELFPDFSFDAVCGARDDTPLKPAPDAALKIAALLGANPSETIILGDMAADMMTARNAEMTGVGALWGFGTKESLSIHGAKYLIEQPIDIIKIIKE